MPRAIFVANPENGGSMHNRGTAVDITLVKLDGNSIDMGTSFVFLVKKLTLIILIYLMKY